MGKRLTGVAQLNDQYLINLARNDKMLKIFPFLKRVYTTAKGKSCCGGRRKKLVDSKQLNTIRMQFLNEPSEKLEQLKDFLGVGRLCITYRDTSGGLKSKVL